MLACAQLTIESEDMSRRRLKVPLGLTVVAIGTALSGCPNPPPHASPSRQCGNEFYCTSDAARAENCIDAGSPSGVYASDLGSCYPPV
jgi:hypothetical protein